MRWDDAQYLRFEAERTRPAGELLARVQLTCPARVIDLGCGPGNSTALLCERWPSAHVIGVDSSPEMLARARARLPEIELVQADVARYAPEPAQLLFANALFQWLPEHPALLTALMQSLAPGGVLAFQVPDNLDQPSHRLMHELDGPWAEATRALAPRATIREPAFYFDLLAPLSSEVDVWRTVYEHVMPDPGAIVAWVEGTGLRPYLEAVPDRAAYLRAYTEAIAAAYPAHHGGARLLSFPRLFVVARRTG